MENLVEDKNNTLQKVIKQRADDLSADTTLKGMYVIDGFAREFEDIEKVTSIDGETGDRTSARMPENRRKNRHSNVLPYEETRVKLHDGGSDYINANYIKQAGSNIVYIAAQAPLESTVIDFWRMVWQDSSSIIVMLTRIIEDRREKCHRYYPTHKNPEKDVQQFKIKLLSKEKKKYNSALVIRRLNLTHLALSESREIIHFQYKEWPDHEPPASTFVFTELLRAVNNIHAKQIEKPLVVHCSAGIGRTGTFCTVHSVLNNVQALKCPDSQLIKNTVLQLRSSRCGMVQTKDQYQFCYRSIIEVLSEEKQ